MQIHTAPAGLLTVFAAGALLLAGCASPTIMESSAPNSTGVTQSPESITTSNTIPVSISPAPPTSSLAITTASPAPTPTPTIIGLLAPKALTDMTAFERYKGEDGGLYDGGMNVPPPA